jgi:replicative DNA helicase
LAIQPESIEFFRRVPPHSRELEEAVLSAILQDPTDAMTAALELLSRDSFYFEAHQVIWDAAVTLHNRGVPPDNVSVIAHLREMDKLDQAGGESYVIQVLAAVPNASAIQNHTIQLHEKALLRNLISECNEIIARAYDQGRDVQELLDFAERQILQLDLRMATGHFSAIDDAIRAFMNTFEQMEVTAA